jgi:hypothetical protein
MSARDETDCGYENHETALVSFYLAGNMNGGEATARRFTALVESRRR